MVGDARPLRVLVVGAGVAGISVARGLLRDGHDVTVFERRPRLAAAGGAVTVWSNGETVLRQLGVEMDGAGRQLSSVRAVTSTGRPLATLDVTAMARRLGAPVRMVPRRVLLERLLDGFPTGRIHCDRRAVALATSRDGVSVEFTDGTVAEGDVLIGADGLHSMVREWVGARHAKATGWCSWQGLVSLPEIAESDAALMMIGGGGNLGLWPAGGAEVQWWFDLPWSTGFVRPQHPIETIRSHFAGWSEPVDRVLAILTDEDLAASPFPHFRHPDPAPRAGPGHPAGRRRAHHAAHPGAGDEPGAARHDGAVPGAGRFRAGDTRRPGRRRERAALVRRPGAAGSGRCPGWPRCRCRTARPCCARPRWSPTGCRPPR